MSSWQGLEQVFVCLFFILSCLTREGNRSVRVRRTHTLRSASPSPLVHDSPFTLTSRSPRVCLVFALRLPLLVWKTWKDEARSACYQDVGHDFISIRPGKRTVWQCVSVFMDVKSMYCVGRKTFYMNMHGCGTHSQWLQKKKQKWQRTIWEPSNKKKHVRIVLW